MSYNMPWPEGPLWYHILRECRAMARYALATGMTVPPDLSAKLESFEAMVGPEERTARAGSKKGIEASGVVGDNAKPELSNRPNSRQLTSVHNRLAELVAPATPKTILLFADEEMKGGR